MEKAVFDCRRCNKCDTIISVVFKIDTGKGYEYVNENTKDRYIDRFGYERNYCKSCMK